MRLPQPHPPNLGLLFTRIAQETSQQAAVAFEEDVALTYGELDSLSNRAAAFLADAGARRGDRIAFQLDKCATAYVLILGALKAGVAYVAIDPRSPALRTEAILEQCTPVLFFGTAGGHRPADVPFVECDAAASAPAFAADRPDRRCDPDGVVDGATPAYVMFTSGSTGTPKGAVMSHDNVLHLVDWSRAEYGFEPGEVHTALNPLHFDNSVFDLYSTLFSGGTLVPFDLPTLQDPFALTERLQAMRCGTWFSVPSLLMFLQVTKAATRETLGGLERIIFGGEGYPKPRLKALFDLVGESAELHNVYGPTECTCICSSYRVTAADFTDLAGYPPIGEVSRWFSCLLLDEDGTEVPDGAPGELYLGGPCVGLGYFNREELSRAAFVQSPLQQAYREVLYRTGDLMRRDPADGKLHFVGRRDLQIKHMGHRIELEEVQHALARHPSVSEAVVVHRVSGDLSELVAIVSARAELEVDELRAHAAQHLPPYMRPSRIHLVAELPKNANGKTDRRALAVEYGS